MDEETTETVESEETELEQTDAEVQEEEQQEEDPNTGLKSALGKERAANKANAKLIAQLQQQIADRDKPADELAIEQAKRDAVAEAMAGVNRRAVEVDFRAAAKDRGLAPETALALADLSNVEVGEGGVVDAADLAAALDAVVSKHPTLVPSRFQGTADQGARGKQAEKTRIDPNDLIRAAFRKKD